MKVNAVRCPKCGDLIYSRARHDFNYCSCKNTAVDGGFDNEYLRIMCTEGIENIKVEKIEVYATPKQLIDDWNEGKNKFGRIPKSKQK